jgi:uncharacterized protein YggE
VIREFAILVLLATGATTLAGQRNPPPDTLAVVVTSGVGEINLTPDRAELRISVETRDSTASAAAARNAARLRRVVDSLSAVRLADESVQVVAVSVRPRENYERGEITGYEASATVRVALRAVDRVAAIIDVALRTGATGVEDIDFLSDREDAARSEVLERAYGRAYNDALALAKAAGMELGPLLRLSTGTDPSMNFAVYAEAQAAFGRQVSIAPQDVRVTAAVTGTWRLSPGHR